MAIVEAGGVLLPEQQYAIGQRSSRAQQDQRFRANVARRRSEQRMAAIDGAHRHRIEALDCAIDDPGLDRSDMAGFDAEAAAVGDQRQDSMIKAKQSRPIAGNDIEQPIQAIRFEHCNDRRVNCRRRARMAASEGDQVFLGALRGAKPVAKRGNGALFEGNDRALAAYPRATGLIILPIGADFSRKSSLAGVPRTPVLRSSARSLPSP